jgi:hypothetical protein
MRKAHLLIILWLQIHLGKSQNLRRHIQRDLISTDIQSQQYRVTVINDHEELEDGTVIQAPEQFACIPIVDGKESSELYKINLPNEIVNQNQKSIHQGNLFLSITHISLHEGKVTLSDESEITVIPDPTSHKRTANVGVIGTMTITVVRISTRDSTPTFSAKELEEGMFDPTNVNVMTQYLACSSNQLRWQMASSGVIEVFVDAPVSDFPGALPLISAAQQVLRAQGIEVSRLADKVLFIVPNGTGKWVASSSVNHWRAQFNDEWGLSLTALMHEIGHTVGLLHSNENGVAYGDATGYMASGHKQKDWPRKCFNGLENSQLGWFKDRELRISQGFEMGFIIKLATFVDYQKALQDEPVIINIADKLFLQYNRAKEFNIDTEEKKDQVTATAPGQGGTDGLAGLDIKQQYTIQNFLNSGRTLIIEVCAKLIGQNKADIALMSIAYDKSLCSDMITNTFQSSGSSSTLQDNLSPQNSEAPKVTKGSPEKALETKSPTFTSLDSTLPGESQSQPPDTQSTDIAPVGRYGFPNLFKAGTKPEEYTSESFRLPSVFEAESQQP